MIDRRCFLARLSGAAVTMLPAFHLLGEAPPQKRIRVGAQTNTWGAPIKTYDHLLEVLDALVKLGYEGFETSDMSLQSQADNARQCRAAFEARHIQYVAPHCGVRFATSVDAAKQVESIRTIAGYSAVMGAKYLVCSGAFSKTDAMPVGDKAKLLNDAAKASHQEGLTFCYHNHIPEFRGDHPEIDELLKQTDPKLVYLNYDVGNAYPIGPNPADFSAQHYKRILIYHIKDVTLDANGKQVPTDLGAGKIDLNGVIAPLLTSDWKGWLIVEREAGYPNAAANPEELLQQCRTYIRDIAKV